MLPLDSLEPSKKISVVVMGSGGMLGHELVSYLQQQYGEVWQVVGLARQDLDLNQPLDKILSILERVQPTLVVNAAAFTAVDAAESQPELADAINNLGAKTLALACQALQVPLIHLSTDQVFEGISETPYVPEDQPNPVNVYGLSKWRGEQAIQALNGEYYILRTSWLYGGTQRHHFVQYVLAQAEKGQPFPIVSDWWGSPTWTLDLSRVVAEMVMGLVQTPSLDSHQRYLPGIYHANNHGVASKFEQAQAILERWGYPVEWVQPISWKSLSFQARRPAYTPMVSSFSSLLSWQEALTQYHQWVLDDNAIPINPQTNLTSKMGNTGITAISSVE